MTNKHKDTKDLRAAFFDKTQETLVIFDKDLNFIDVNEALLTTLHLTREQIIGKNLRNISPGIEETERYAIYQEVLQTGKPCTMDEIKIHPSLGNYISRISIFKLGEHLGLSALNITDLKEAVDELETFVYKTSHDLRAPIASILGLINITDTYITDIDTAKQYIKIIKEQTEHLDTIIRKLIETTSIREGNKVIHLIDFDELVRKVLKSLTHMKGYNEIRITHNIVVVQKFYSDKKLLTSLFQNLIDNAIKYKKGNYKDAYINISVSDEYGGVKISVEDNGIGIAEHLQKNVFKMFYRATDKASGSGLGLYTVNHAVKKLGGQIVLESKEKKGTTFSVYLPTDKKTA